MVVGFLSKLFGRPSKPSQQTTVEPTEYKGYLIYPQATEEGGQYRISGSITKTINQELKTHRFIRSDVVSSEGDANKIMLSKSQMFIDQTGDKMFE
jgi:hypothetical protein